jgi:hypothetical protein
MRTYDCEQQEKTWYGEVLDLRRRLKVIAEHICNGDVHPYSKLERLWDKNENARMWRASHDKVSKVLERLAAEKGWKVEYNGLMPDLVKDGRYMGQ